MLVDFSDAPHDPIERLIWLSGIEDAVATEIEREWQQAYFWSRFTGRLKEAEALHLHSHKRLMAFTRAENEDRGRMIRWGDHQA